MGVLSSMFVEMQVWGNQR